MKKILIILLGTTLSVGCLFLFYQLTTAPISLIKRLHWDSNKIYLLLHADDLGISFGTNEAFIKAFDAKRIRSGSIMAVGDAFNEIIRFGLQNPSADLGVHLTLTSEWQNGRWKPILPKEKVSSLVNSEGYFYATCQDVISHADLKEVEQELRAQIQKIKNSGINISHLDSHMGCLLQNPALFEIYMRLGREFHAPSRISRNLLKISLKPYIKPNDIVLDSMLIPSSNTPLSALKRIYAEQISQLKQGVYLLYLHPSAEDITTNQMMGNTLPWGYQWRKIDYEFLMSEEFNKTIKNGQLSLVTWKDLTIALKQKD